MKKLVLACLVFTGCAGLHKKPAETIWEKCSEGTVDVKTGDKTFICYTHNGEAYKVTVHREGK
jgi:hypothetical protein